MYVFHVGIIGCLLHCGVCLGRPFISATCALVSSATHYIVRLLEGSMMVLHLSGIPLIQTASSWDVAKQGVSLLFHLFGSFHSSTYISPYV